MDIKLEEIKTEQCNICGVAKVMINPPICFMCRMGKRYKTRFQAESKPQKKHNYKKVTVTGDHWDHAYLFGIRK